MNGRDLSRYIFKYIYIKANQNTTKTGILEHILSSELELAALPGWLA